MKIKRLNIAVGGAAIVAAGIGGMVLGATYEPTFSDGYYKVTLIRALLKAGHTHGMLFALFNLLAGLLIPRLALSRRLQALCSWLAVAAFIMPLGLVLRGLDHGARTFMPLGILGGACFIAAALIMFIGAVRRAQA